MFCALVTMNVLSQNNTVKHVIDRGETLASIASLYNTTAEEIIAYNPDASDLVYVGMELDIPYVVTSGTGPMLASDETASSDFIRTTVVMDRECAEADRLLEDQEYRKAAKAYSKIIKTYDSDAYSCADAYYGRGIAYYNQGKWKSAIKDFECVISDTRCDEAIRTHCTALLADARRYREEQLERRSEMWGALITTAAAVTTTAIVASQQSKSSAYSSSGKASNNNLSYLTNPNYTVQQYNTQIETEYQQARSYNPSLTREQFMNMRAQACNEVKNSTETNSVTTTANSDSQTNISTNRKKDCPSLYKNNGKWFCVNTGKCGMCGGDGLMDDMFGQGPNSLKCTLCGGTGKCKYCQQ